MNDSPTRLVASIQGWTTCFGDGAGTTGLSGWQDLAINRYAPLLSADPQTGASMLSLDERIAASWPCLIHDEQNWHAGLMVLTDRQLLASWQTTDQAPRIVDLLLNSLKSLDPGTLRPAAPDSAAAGYRLSLAEPVGGRAEIDFALPVTPHGFSLPEVFQSNNVALGAPLSAFAQPDPQVAPTTLGAPPAAASVAPTVIRPPDAAESVPAAPSAKQCSFCGTSTRPTARFCDVCGAAFPDARAGVAPPAETMMAGPQPSPPLNSTVMGPPTGSPSPMGSPPSMSFPPGAASTAPGGQITAVPMYVALGPSAPAGNSGQRRALIAIIVVLSLVIAATAVTILFRQGIIGSPAESPSTDSSTIAAAPTSAATSEAPSQTPTPSIDPREQALAQLNAARNASLQRAVLDGRWILQVGSKYEGVMDERETTSSGSHIFMLPDIWEAHEHAAERFQGQGDVLLLQATDFGRQVSLPATTWVTIVQPSANPITDYNSGIERCAVLFPGLSGDELTNACMPRQLQPPF